MSSLLDVLAGVTQIIRLFSVVHAFIFLARRIQSFLSLVGCEVDFCVLTIQSFSTCWAFNFILHFLGRKNRRHRDSNSRPNVSEGYEVTN